MNNLRPQVVALIAVLALGVGFAGGYFFKTNQTSRTRQNLTGQFQGRNGAVMDRNGAQKQPMRVAGAAEGEVISRDDKSITLKLTDGSSKIIILSDSTTYSEEIIKDIDIIEIGGKVGVFGTPNSDGSITAQNIQLNP